MGQNLGNESVNTQFQPSKALEGHPQNGTLGFNPQVGILVITWFKFLL